MSVLQEMKRRAAALMGARFGPAGLFWFHRAGTLLEHRLHLRDRYAPAGTSEQPCIRVNGLADGSSDAVAATRRTAAAATIANTNTDANGSPRPRAATASALADGASAADNHPAALLELDATPTQAGDAPADRVTGLRVITHASAASVATIRLPAPPRVPWRKPAAPMEQLAYFPRWHTTGHPRAWRFPDTLNDRLPWVRQLQSLYANPISFPSTLSPEAGLLLHALVRNVRPRIVIETGAFIGVSTIWIAAALQANGDAGVLHTFDDFSPIRSMPWCDAEMPDGRLQFVTESLAAAEVTEHIIAHQGHSAASLREAATDLRSAGGVQFAFLDADHGIRGVWHDFWALEPALATGGFIILHDTFPNYCGHEGPRHLLDHVNRYAVGRYEKVDLYLSPINYGLGLLRRVG